MLYATRGSLWIMKPCRVQQKHVLSLWQLVVEEKIKKVNQTLLFYACPSGQTGTVPVAKGLSPLDWWQFQSSTGQYTMYVLKCREKAIKIRDMS